MAYVFLWDGWLDEDKSMHSDTSYNIHHAVEDHRNGIDESEKRILIDVCGERFRRGFHMYIYSLFISHGVQTVRRTIPQTLPHVHEKPVGITLISCDVDWLY